MSSPSSTSSPISRNITTSHVILDIVEALANVVDGMTSRNVDAITSVEPSSSELGALCRIVSETVPVLVQTASSAPTHATSTSAELWVSNDAEEELWTVDAHGNMLHRGSPNSFSAIRTCRFGEGKVGQVALTGETVMDADPHSVAWYLPVRKGLPSKILGVIRVVIGIADRTTPSGSQLRKSHGVDLGSMPNAVSGSMPPTFAHSASSPVPLSYLARASSSSETLRKDLLVVAKHVARAVHQVTQFHVHTSKLEATGSTLSMAQNRLDMASRSYSRLRHQLRVERGLVRCISAIATWPRKGILSASDDDEWAELFQIAEGLVDELLLNDDDNTNDGSKFINDLENNKKKGCDSCRFYVYEPEGERFWCLRDQPKGKDGDSLSNLNISPSRLSRRQYFDASCHHIASTLVSGMPAFNATLPTITEAPIMSRNGVTQNFSNGTVENLSHLIVPVMDEERRLVGALELTNPTLPLPHSMSKSVSILSDYGAQIALAMERLQQRQHARHSHSESLQRLEWSRRRAGLLLAVENLWNDCVKEVQAMRIFEREAKSMIEMGPNGVCVLWIAERAPLGGHSNASTASVEEGPRHRSPTGLGLSRPGAPRRRLWTMETTPSESSGQGKKRYMTVGSNSLVGQAAACGETRCSKDQKSIAIVVRRLSGEVGAVIELSNNTRTETLSELSSDTFSPESSPELNDYNIPQLHRPRQVHKAEAVLLTSKSSQPERSTSSSEQRSENLAISLNSEDEALLKIWARHAAVAITHFESMQGCIRGMSDASDALSLLEKQKARAQTRAHRNAQRALRFCRDVFTGYGMFVPRVFGLDWLKDVEKLCLRIIPSDSACIMLLDARRHVLVGKVKNVDRKNEDSLKTRDRDGTQAPSYRVREIDLDHSPAPIESVAFQQQCTLCEAISFDKYNQKFGYHSDLGRQTVRDDREEKSGYVMCIPIMIRSAKTSNVGVSNESPHSNEESPSQIDPSSPKLPSGIFPPSPPFPESVTPECVGILQLIRLDESFPFSAAEKGTARLLGHILGMLSSNFSETFQMDRNLRKETITKEPQDPIQEFSQNGGKVSPLRAMEVAAARGPMALRHLVQSRRAEKGYNSKMSSLNSRMQTFLNFVAQLNSIAATGDPNLGDLKAKEDFSRSDGGIDSHQDTSVGRLVRIAMQQAKELLLCSGVEMFAVTPLPITSGKHDHRKGKERKKIVCLGSTINREASFIDIETDSPVTRTVLYGRPVVSVTKDSYMTSQEGRTSPPSSSYPGFLTTIRFEKEAKSASYLSDVGTDQILVSIPCCVEIQEGGSMRIDEATGSSAVTVGAVVFLCDPSMEPDADEISMLLGWASALGSGILRCKGARDRGRKLELVCNKLNKAEVQLKAAVSEKKSSLRNVACSRLFYGLFGIHARLLVARSFNLWKKFNLDIMTVPAKSQLAILKGGRRRQDGASANVTTSSSTEARLYLLARDLQCTDSMSEIVSIVPQRLCQVFSRVHVATFHVVDFVAAHSGTSEGSGTNVGGSHIMITADALVPTDGGHGVDTRIDCIRRCAVDGSRITSKTGSRPWLYEPIFMNHKASSIDSGKSSITVGVIEFGFLRSQKQRQQPWLTAAESLVFGEATALITNALTRFVRRRELEEQASGAMESVDAMQTQCDALEQAYNYTENRQVLAQRQLRIATELLAARDLNVLSNAISSARMASLLGADRATLFYRKIPTRQRNSSSSSEYLSVSEFVSTTTPARYRADGVSGIAKAARQGKMVTFKAEGGQHCSYLPINVNTLNMKTRSITKSSDIPIVLDICWKKVEKETSSTNGESDLAHGGVFGGPVSEVDREELLKYLASALEMVVTSFLQNKSMGTSDLRSIFNIAPMEIGDINTNIVEGDLQSEIYTSPTTAGVVAARVLKAMSEVPRMLESKKYKSTSDVGGSGSPLCIEQALMQLVSGPLKVALCAESAMLYVLDQNFHEVVDEWEETVVLNGSTSTGNSLGHDTGDVDPGDDNGQMSDWEMSDSDEEIEKLRHMSDVAAVARLRQARELKRESRRMKREAKRARDRVARLQRNIPAKRKRSRTRKIAAPATHFYRMSEKNDNGKFELHKFPLREGGIGYGDGDGDTFMSSALESGIVGSVFANGMSVMTSSDEMQTAVSERCNEHQVLRENKDEDGAMKDRDFEMPLFLNCKHNSRYNPNVDLSPRDWPGITFDDYSPSNTPAPHFANHALYTVPVISVSSLGRKKIVAVLQVLWRGHSFVPRSAAFMVDSIAKLIFRMAGQSAKSQAKQYTESRAISMTKAGRYSDSDREKPAHLFQNRDAEKAQVVKAKPLSESNSSATARIAKLSLVKHRWLWLVRLLTLSKRKNDMHKLVMTVIEKRRVETEQRLQKELSELAREKSQLELKGGRKGWLNVSL